MKSLLNLKNKAGKDVVITTSWDDFTEFDVRLSQLLIEYDIPAMFYIPAIKLRDKKLLQLAQTLIKYRHFDIGSHTVNHKLLTRVDLDTMEFELNESKKILEKELGVEVRHFCYPRGYYDEVVINMVAGAGYITARTVQVLSTDIEQDPFCLKTTVHAYNGRKEYKGRFWVDIGIELLEKIVREGGYFHLWGHSLEIEKHKDWTTLEWFLSYMNTCIYENLQSEHI